jgi:hypothetical protein
MNNGNEKSPGKKGKEDHQKEITVPNIGYESIDKNCSSTTKLVFVVLFLKVLIFCYNSSRKGAAEQDGDHAEKELFTI